MAFVNAKTTNTLKMCTETQLKMWMPQKKFVLINFN